MYLIAIISVAAGLGMAIEAMLSSRAAKRHVPVRIKRAKTHD